MARRNDLVPSLQSLYHFRSDRTCCTDHQNFHVYLPNNVAQKDRFRKLLLTLPKMLLHTLALCNSGIF